MNLRLALVALCLAAGAAEAHDSWLVPAATTAGTSRLSLELTTGNRYPLGEFPQSAASVAQAKCVDGRGRNSQLRPVQENARSLSLVAALGPGASAVSCGLELHAAQVEIEPRKVEVYFREIRPAQALRQRWSELLERGLPWRETYRKFARIETGGEATPASLKLIRQPMGLGLELVVLGDEVIASGKPVTFQLLRDGQPLAGLPIEFVSERSPLGIWRETDPEGKLQFVLPFGGAWLLRGTDLRLSASDPLAWESRFVTLAIHAR